MTTEKYDLQDILDAVMLAEPRPSHEALVRWMKRYPKFRKELEKFFVSWSEADMWQHLPDSVEIDDEAITERAIKRTLAKRQHYERTRS
jgi:hypothetical protein